MKEERNKGKEGRDGTTTLSSADYVPAEHNLETVGYFSAGYKRRYPTAPREAKVITLGAQRQIKIIPSTYGYPNSEDLDFYRAFLKICDEQATLAERSANGQRTLHPQFRLPIGFYTRELIRLAGREKNARELEAVRDWVRRNASTLIEGALYRAKSRQFDASFGSSLFSQFVLVGDKMRNGHAADMNYVWPSPWFLSNYYYRYFHPVDLAFHRRLRKPIAKALYPLFDTGWYAARSQTLHETLRGPL